MSQRERKLREHQHRRRPPLPERPGGFVITTTPTNGIVGHIRGGHAPPPSTVQPSVSLGTSATRSGSLCGGDLMEDSLSQHQPKQLQSRPLPRLPLQHCPSPKGLLNVGNTCYANAAIQCLLSTALAQALLDPNACAVFRRYSSNPTLLEQGSGSVDSADHQQPDPPEGQLLLRPPGAPPEPASSKRRDSKRRKERDDNRVQENCLWLTRQLKALTVEYHLHDDHTTNSSSAASVWNLASPFLQHALPRKDPVVVDPGAITRYPHRLSPCLRPYQQEDAHEFLRALLGTLVMHGQNKRLSSLFDGLLESAVICQTCGRHSLKRDRYMDLSLDINMPHVSTLSEALEEYTQTETLSGDNRVYCPHCETKRVTTKRLRLATAPSILVCHLKRFAFDRFGRLIRLHKRVTFPLRLEIADFMSKVNQARPPPYELVAVLVHQGASCDSGHYLAYVKRDGQWFRCNDSVIERVTVETVLQQEAYILMYEVADMRELNGYPSPHKAFIPTGGTRTSLRSGRGSDATRPSTLPMLLCGVDDSILRDFCCYDAALFRFRQGGVHSTGNSNSSRSSSGRSGRRRRRDNNNDGESGGGGGGGGGSSTASSRRRQAPRDDSTLEDSTVCTGDRSLIHQYPYNSIRRSSSTDNLTYANHHHHHNSSTLNNHHLGYYLYRPGVNTDGVPAPSNSSNSRAAAEIGQYYYELDDHRDDDDDIGMGGVEDGLHHIHHYQTTTTTTPTALAAAKQWSGTVTTHNNSSIIGAGGGSGGIVATTGGPSSRNSRRNITTPSSSRGLGSSSLNATTEHVVVVVNTVAGDSSSTALPIQQAMWNELRPPRNPMTRLVTDGL